MGGGNCSCTSFFPRNILCSEFNHLFPQAQNFPTGISTSMTLVNQQTVCSLHTHTHARPFMRISLQGSKTELDVSSPSDAPTNTSQPRPLIAVSHRSGEIVTAA